MRAGWFTASVWFMTTKIVSSCLAHSSDLLRQVAISYHPNSYMVLSWLALEIIQLIYSSVHHYKYVSVILHTLFCTHHMI